MTKQLTVEDLAKLTHKQQVQVAIYAAELVTDLVEAEHRPLADKCIEVAKKWLRGEATAEEYEELARVNWETETDETDVVWVAEAVVWAIGASGAAGAATFTAEAVESAIEASPDKQEAIDKIYAFYDNLLKEVK